MGKWARKTSHISAVIEVSNHEKLCNKGKDCNFYTDPPNTGKIKGQAFCKIFERFLKTEHEEVFDGYGTIKIYKCPDCLKLIRVHDRQDNNKGG